MRIDGAIFTLPKAGNTPSEYEDAVWPNILHTEVAQNKYRCAVADGATETSYSCLWAQALVSGYAEGRLDLQGDGLKGLEGLETVRENWRHAVEKSLGGRPRPWYAIAKAEMGAFAALVTLEVEEGPDPEGGLWSSYAVGDSCLIQMRGDRRLDAFPIDRSEDFNSRPRLLGSNPSDIVDVTTWVQPRRASWEYNDTFFLMTDAIACWFIRQQENGERPWERLMALESEDLDGFRVWIDSLRGSERATEVLKNDDVTILRLRLLSEGAE